MNNRLHNLQKEAQNIRLTQREKQVMRARVFDMARASSAAYTAQPRLVRSSYSWFSIRFAVPVAAVLVVMLGSGTAYAAQGALPGDLLYTVKTDITEPVAGALAFSDEAKVSFHTTVAENRLKEAEALASQGKLDATTTAQIETNFEDHVAQAHAIAKTLEQTDEGAAVEATTRLDSSLSAHGSILASIGDNSDNEQTRENSNTIAMRVRSHDGRGGGDWGDSSGAVVAVDTSATPQVQTMSLTIAPEASSSDEVPTAHVRTFAARKIAAPVAFVQGSTTQKVALQLQKRAQGQLRDTQQAFDSVKGSLEASTTENVIAQLLVIQKRMDDGVSQLQSGAFDAARTTFTDVLQHSIELSTFVTASKSFNTDFVRTWKRGGKDDNTNTEGRHGNDSKNVLTPTTTGSVNIEDAQTNQDGGGVHGGKGKPSATPQSGGEHD